MGSMSKLDRFTMALGKSLLVLGPLYLIAQLIRIAI